MRTKTLVTGGAGFIGSHLCERLLDDGHDLAILDDLNDFYPPAMKLENIEAIRTHGPLRAYCKDICDAPAVLDIFRAERPELVIHLAARAGVRPSIEEPYLYGRVNVLGTMSVLEASRLTGVRKFVFASSSSIYGIANHVPFREDDPVNLPISPYAATKIAGEKLAFTYSHLYQLPVVCLRFFTVYGPRQRPDLAIRKFAERIEAGRSIPVFGDGRSARDYTYVADIVQGIVSAANYDCRYDVFNLGNSNPVKLRTLIEVLENAIGRKARIENLPEQPGDVPITFASIEKAATAFGYAPATSFPEGVARFVDWFQPRRDRAAGPLPVSRVAHAGR